MKASFHRDRRCSVGFTKEYEDIARARFGTAARHWQRWTLAEAEVVRIAQVIFPDSDLSIHEAEDSPQMRWIPAPGAGNAVVVSIFVAEPAARFNWPGPEIGGDLFGIMQAPTRFTWVVHKAQPLDLNTIELINDARSKALGMPTDMEVPRDDPALRIAVWGHGESVADMFFIELCAATK